jgi:hypothetical protein
MFEFLIELVFQVSGEIFVDAAVNHVSSEGFGSTSVAVAGHFVAGITIGGCSLYFFPHHVLGAFPIRAAAICLVPLAIGTGFAALERGKATGDPFRRFMTAAAFALGFSVVRFFFAV